MEENRAFLYGESLFVTLRIRNGKILFRNNHFTRLKTQVEDFFIRQKLNAKEEQILKDQFEKALDFTSEGIIRITIFSNKNEELVPSEYSIQDLNFHFSSRELPTSSKVDLMSMESFYSEKYPNFKLGTYALNFFARRNAIECGFDDVLFIRNAEVLEASTSNVVFCKNEQFYTPENVIYSGNTIDVFSKSFNAKKIKINYNSLNNFECAFILNSASIILGVNKVDDIIFKVDNKLTEKYKNKLIEIGLE